MLAGASRSSFRGLTFTTHRPLPQSSLGSNWVSLPWHQERSLRLASSSFTQASTSLHRSKSTAWPSNIPGRLLVTSQICILLSFNPQIVQIVHLAHPLCPMRHTNTIYERVPAASALSNLFARTSSAGLSHKKPGCCRDHSRRAQTINGDTFCHRER
jgi:hypothetical protein